MPVSNRSEIKPGDQFERVYLGKKYTCQAKQIGNGIGFETWDGQQFRTLSTAGKHVIGTECNGYVWWYRQGELPTARGPKPGSHNIRTLGKQAPTMRRVRGTVRASAPAHTSPSLRKVAAMSTKKRAKKPNSKAMIRNLKLADDQIGLRPGQRRYDCLACGGTFVTTDNPPSVCLRGHEAKMQANTVREFAAKMIA